MKMKARRKNAAAAIPAGCIGLDLFTEDGEYVTTAVTPAFQALPIVLTWGARVFVWKRDIRYHEAAYHVVTLHIHRPPPEMNTIPLADGLSKERSKP